MSAPTVLLVLAAGAVGAGLRWGVSLAFARTRFPWAVLVVNVVGSAVAGAAIALTAGDLQVIVVTGFCGGLTTFSTFAVETVQLIERGRTRAAVVSVAANLALGTAACAAAWAITALLM